jgi:hypothetical protein
MTHFNTRIMAVASVALLGMTAWVCAEAGPGKKLIEYGWDARSPAYVVEHIREMEKRPFDGIVVQTAPNSFSDVFYNKELDDEQTAAYLKAMESIQWEKFTDNFFMMYARSNMDWFSDEDWAPDGWVLRNVRLCAKAAKVGRCKGVCFDAESYVGLRPWWYVRQNHADKKSFAEFERIVRKRGSQWMEALQAEYPDLVVFNLYLLAYPAYSEARNEPDPVKRGEIMQETFEDECLWPAFVNGMAEAARGNTIIVDGNEGAYYYDNAAKFSNSVQVMRKGVKNFFDSVSWPKYRQHVQPGHAIWGDNLCSLLLMRRTSSVMSPEERAKWVEHNVYYALKTSDQYAWMYVQRMDWWEDLRVPPYLEDAIRSARRKVADGEPLGFDIEPVCSRANKQLWEDRGDFEPQAAKIRRLNGPVPEIGPSGYGTLDDAAWKNATQIGPFVAIVEAPEYNLSATTRAYVTYDDQNLYVGFECKEPNVMKLCPSFLRFDSGAWQQDWDDVSVILAPESDRSAWRSFGVGADGNRKDVHPDGESANWKPDYRSAIRFAKDQWSVEMAIPWRALSRTTPKSGEKLAANVAHMRLRWNDEQYSTWSKFRGRRREPSYTRVEPEHLGVWVFE